MGGWFSQISVKDKSLQSGNVFFALFGAVGLVGVLGASSMIIMKGPVAGMQKVTKYTIAENQMIASGRLSLVAAATALNNGDCDNDTFIEPVPWAVPAAGIPAPSGGGLIPTTIGASRQDPWGSTYGYCAWDHGTQIARRVWRRDAKASARHQRAG